MRIRGVQEISKICEVSTADMQKLAENIYFGDSKRAESDTQETLFNVYGDAFDDECYDHEKILKECIIQCKIRR